jgi:hypothetical protein
MRYLSGKDLHTFSSTFQEIGMVRYTFNGKFPTDRIMKILWPSDDIRHLSDTQNEHDPCKRIM